MLRTIAKSHKEPSRTFQAIVVGFAIGVFAALVIGLWQEITITCRMTLLLVLGVSLYFSWELTKPKNDYPNDGNDCTNNNPNRVVNSKPKDESSSRSTYKQTYSKPFHSFLASFHHYFVPNINIQHPITRSAIAVIHATGSGAFTGRKLYPIAKRAIPNAMFARLRSMFLIPPLQFFPFLCYNVLAYVGGEGFEPSWLVADGCQDRYVCQFHHPPTTENWGECSTKMLLALNPLKLILATVFCFVKDKKISIAIFFPINLCGGNYAYMS